MTSARLRTAQGWRVLRLDALFGITVTFVTYAVLLAPQRLPRIRTRTRPASMAG